VINFFFTCILFVQVENLIFAGVQCWYCIFHSDEVLIFFGQNKEHKFIGKLVRFLGCIQLSFVILAVHGICTFNKDHSKFNCLLFVIYTAAICYGLYEIKELKSWEATYSIIFLSALYSCMRNFTFLCWRK
jgi:hypothetical protein